MEQVTQIIQKPQISKLNIYEYIFNDCAPNMGTYIVYEYITHYPENPK